jgi:integrase/recombinase XerD
MYGQEIESFLIWLVEERHCTENTIAAYRNDLTQFLGFLSANVVVETLAGVTEGVVWAYLAELQARDYAPATVARKLAAVRSLFHYLVLTEDLEDDPTVQVGVGSVSRPRSEQLPHQAVQQLSDSVGDDSPLDLRDRALITLVAGVGLKASQVIGLNLEDLDLQAETGTVRVRGRRGKDEVLALPPSVTADLARYVDEGWPLLVTGKARAEQPTPLFPNARGQRLTRQGLRRVWNRRCRRGRCEVCGGMAEQGKVGSHSQFTLKEKHNILHCHYWLMAMRSATWPTFWRKEPEAWR